MGHRSDSLTRTKVWTQVRAPLQGSLPACGPHLSSETLLGTQRLLRQERGRRTARLLTWAAIIIMIVEMLCQLSQTRRCVQLLRLDLYDIMVSILSHARNCNAVRLVQRIVAMYSS
jgi:hypothetical protein